MTATRLTASEMIAIYHEDTWARAVKVIKNDVNQVLRTAKEFQRPGNQTLMHWEANKLVIAAVAWS